MTSCVTDQAFLEPLFVKQMYKSQPGSSFTVTLRLHTARLTRK